MSNLINSIWVEKYRPSKLEDLIFNDKPKILNILKDNKSIPSLLLYSVSPGTGKTTLAKIITSYLKSDTLHFNASKDRGIDILREQILLFSQSLSSSDSKRCVFMDEFDGSTIQLQNALKSMMEEYSDNVFFIFTANNVEKVINPIRSRCIEISFENPSKKEILSRLEYICTQESITYDIEDLYQLLSKYYPDIRRMVLALQDVKSNGTTLANIENDYEEILRMVVMKNAKELYSKVYAQDGFDIMSFNKWLFRHLYENYDIYGYEKVAKATRYLADTEKSYNLGITLPVVFLANILSVSDILSSNEK